MRNLSAVQLLVCWVVLVGALGGLGVLPRWQSIRQLEAKSAELARMIRESDDVNAQVGLLIDWKLEIERSVATSTTPIPGESDVAGLMRDLTRKLIDLRITEREITTGAAVETDEASALPLSVTMRGRYPSVLEAVRWIEALPRLVRVRRIKIDRSNGWTPEQPLVTAELLVDVFFAARPIDPKLDLAMLVAPGKEGSR